MKPITSVVALLADTSYGVSYGMEGVYEPGANAGIEKDIGPVFMKMLVEKYGSRL